MVCPVKRKKKLVDVQAASTGMACPARRLTGQHTFACPHRIQRLRQRQLRIQVVRLRQHHAPQAITARVYCPAAKAARPMAASNSGSPARCGSWTSPFKGRNECTLPREQGTLVQYTVGQRGTARQHPKTQTTHQNPCAHPRIDRHVNPFSGGFQSTPIQRACGQLYRRIQLPVPGSMALAVLSVPRRGHGGGFLALCPGGTPCPAPGG